MGADRGGDAWHAARAVLISLLSPAPPRPTLPTKSSCRNLPTRSDGVLVVGDRDGLMAGKPQITLYLCLNGYRAHAAFALFRV